MRYLLNNSTDPYFNMALDEFCLENLVLDEPYFYLWRNRPSVIIGLNQNAYSEVNLVYLNANGITLARRVTGGGAVYHDLQNLNYTIVAPLPCHPERCPEPVEGRSEGSTPVPIVEALRQLGVPAELTGRNDIFVEGRKVSGYARRVSKRQEIIHGTLMYDVDLDTLTHVLDTPESKLNAKGIGSVKSRVANLKDYLPGFKSLDEVQAALQDILASGDCQMELTESQLNEVRTMAETKFSTWDFIYGRSRQADLFRSAKLPCGAVEAAISLDRGLITGISFSGDFMFDEPAEGLAAALVGCRFEHDALASVLGKTDVSRFFRDTNSSDVLDLILT
ncbi:MAG: lipoate--protein ligase [Bacteroidales bacterium]|nr:lipoate--protein ligase [Bacteroidales bacterium]